MEAPRPTPSQSTERPAEAMEAAITTEARKITEEKRITKTTKATEMTNTNRSVLMRPFHYPGVKEIIKAMKIMGIKEVTETTEMMTIDQQ